MTRTNWAQCCRCAIAGRTGRAVWIHNKGVTRSCGGSRPRMLGDPAIYFIFVCLSRGCRAVLYLLPSRVTRCSCRSACTAIACSCPCLQVFKVCAAQKGCSVLFETTHATACCDFRHISIIKNHFIVMFLSCHSLMVSLSSKWDWKGKWGIINSLFGGL